MKGGLLLGIVVGEGAVILELFVSEDGALLIGWDTVLDLGLNIVNDVR